MGRKKKKASKPWCWYCNRNFEDEKILIQHQKAKHFKCETCHKRLYTAPGLQIHCLQVHKENLEKVPNSLPNRGDITLEIYGMEGIPDDADDYIESEPSTSTPTFIPPQPINGYFPIPPPPPIYQTYNNNHFMPPPLPPLPPIPPPMSLPSRYPMATTIDPQSMMISKANLDSTNNYNYNKTVTMTTSVNNMAARMQLPPPPIPLLLWQPPIIGDQNENKSSFSTPNPSCHDVQKSVFDTRDSSCTTSSTLTDYLNETPNLATSQPSRTNVHSLLKIGNPPSDSTPNMGLNTPTSTNKDDSYRAFGQQTNKQPLMLTSSGYILRIMYPDFDISPEELKALDPKYEYTYAEDLIKSHVNNPTSSSLNINKNISNSSDIKNNNLNNTKRVKLNDETSNHSSVSKTSPYENSNMESNYHLTNSNANNYSHPNTITPKSTLDNDITLKPPPIPPLNFPMSSLPHPMQLLPPPPIYNQQSISQSINHLSSYISTHTNFSVNQFSHTLQTTTPDNKFHDFILSPMPNRNVPNHETSYGNNSYNGPLLFPPFMNNNYNKHPNFNNQNRS